MKIAMRTRLEAAERKLYNRLSKHKRYDFAKQLAESQTPTGRLIFIVSELSDRRG